MKLHRNYIQRPSGISPLKFYILLWKRYFDQGYNMLNYPKYLVAVFGVTTQNIGATAWLAVIFTGACFVLGWFWYAYDLVTVDTEIGNLYNPFVHEMRRAIKSNRAEGECTCPTGLSKDVYLNSCKAHGHI